MGGINDAYDIISARVLVLVESKTGSAFVVF